MTKLSKWRNNNRPKAPDILAIHNASDIRGNSPVPFIECCSHSWYTYYIMCQ